MAKNCTRRARFCRGNVTPPPADGLTSRLNQEAWSEAPPQLRQIIREHAGDLLRMQTAIEAYLREHIAEDQRNIRLLVLRIFNMRELP